MKTKFLGFAVALVGCVAVLPAYALTADGLTYTLTAFKTANPDVDNYTLTISGINAPSDTEGGRYGVLALAFNEPSGFVSATAPSGFTEMSGGLDASGCTGSGNFFCFKDNGSITQSALAANSQLTFDFSVNATGLSTWGSMATPDDFKITWDGSNSKTHRDGTFTSGYDLVSENLQPTPAKAPEIDPASASAALTFLAGGLTVLRGRRRRS